MSVGQKKRKGEEEELAKDSRSILSASSFLCRIPYILFTIFILSYHFLSINSEGKEIRGKKNGEGYNWFDM